MYAPPPQVFPSSVISEFTKSIGFANIAVLAE